MSVLIVARWHTYARGRTATKVIMRGRRGILVIGSIVVDKQGEA